MDNDSDTNMISKRSCTRTTEHTDEPSVDRLSNLPDELLIRILSLLPTKYAAATCALSRRLKRVFPWITSLDFDIPPICHCAAHPYAIQQFPSFVTFVDTVLSAHQSPCLTRFRLGASLNLYNMHHWFCRSRGLRDNCLPDLTSNQVHSWMAFPLACYGLKELDLRIHKKVSSHDQLPPAIFDCETLETLRLDVNLGFDLVSSMSSFHLPNLKQLHLRACRVSGDEFVQRLFSGCPVLEDLEMEASWHRFHCISICSTSLRRFHFTVYSSVDNKGSYTDFVLIDTPKLEDLSYSEESDSLHQCFFTNFDCVLKATIDVENALKVLSFIRSLSNAEHLCLYGFLSEDLEGIELMDQLPVFRNLKYLHLGYHGYVFWDVVLLAFLNRSPVLETLAFKEGLVAFGYPTNHREALGESEQEFFRTAQVIIPECCKSHLKRIVIEQYFGDNREVNVIQFLLRHALVLEELVVFPSRSPSHETPDLKSMENTLRNLPKVSSNCSIQVLIR